MKDDLRPNSILDEAFGVISDAAQRAVDADSKIKGDTQDVVAWKERDKPDPKDAFGDMTHAVNAKPEVDVTDASARKIGDAVAESVQKKSAGTTANVGNGEPTTTGGPRQRDEWGRFLPGPQKAPPPPGEGEQAGKKAGSWVGRGIGGVLGGLVGGYFGGPAGARVGTAMGAAIGGGVGGGGGSGTPGSPQAGGPDDGGIGGRIGAGFGQMYDRTKDVALSPDSQDSLARVMPDAIQAVIKWYRELDKATETILRHNFQLSQASAEMGAVQAERDARETFRDKEKGDRLSASAEYLSRSEQERKDSTKGIEILAGKVDNYVQGFKERLAGALIAPINKMAEGINRLVEMAEDKQGRALTPEEYMNKVADRTEASIEKNMARQRALSEEMNRNAGRRFY